MAKRKRILICDDEESILKVITCILEDNDYEVEAAANGLAALEKFRQDNFDLLVIDIHMPFLDGFATIARIRENDQETPIILEGSYQTPESIKLAQELKVAAYLVKPFEVKDLLEIVNSVLTGGK